MFNINWKKLSLTAGLSLSLIAAGCGGGGSEESSGGEEAPKKEETASLAEELDMTITGIDAGAGVVAAAEQAVKDYELEGYEVQTSSGGAMTQALADAIEDEEPIVVTGWTPHWKFAKYDLKYLEDPKGTFGGAEEIHTIGRKDLETDLPNAYKVLDQFNWTAKDMETVMLEVNEGAEPEEAAANWIKENEDTVKEWTKGAEKVEGKDINLAYVAWDSEIASTNVIGQVLESVGFNVELTQLEAPYMWEAVATGEADAMVAAWLPGTHKKYMADHKENIDDMGANLEGAKIGLVVPEYVEAESIADLKK